MKGAWEAERDPLAALQRGDPGLFEEFVRTEAPTLVGFFRRLGAERSEAEDLSQEVFVKLFRVAPSYQRQGSFASFALRIARNAWVDRKRRAAARPDGAERIGKLPERGAAQLVTAELDAVGQMSLREDSERLREAIAALPEAHAIVFELAVVQGLPYGDIATALDIPVGTVKSRVFNAVRKLRATLGVAQAEGEEGVA